MKKVKPIPSGIRGDLKRIEVADTVFQGERGLQGEQGDKGETGERGLRGERGAKGDRGPQGIQGARGPKGEQGGRGEKGDRGEPGARGPRGDDGQDGITTVVHEQRDLTREDWTNDYPFAARVEPRDEVLILSERDREIQRANISQLPQNTFFVGGRSDSSGGNGNGGVGGFFPTLIQDGETFEVPENFQALYNASFCNNGLLTNDGLIVEVA